MTAMPTAAQGPTPAPVLHPGDAIRITVWRQPDLTGEFWIAADSSVRHPLYQTLKVAGVPLDTVRARLTMFLSRFQETPQFVIEPLFRVAVGGEVNQPGLYTFRPEITIAQAVVLAGGLTPRARWEDVRLLRDGLTYSADLTRPERGLAQAPIHSGDQIVVLPRRRALYSFLVPSATLVTTVVTLLTVLRQ
jgi:protein involved in polysaccharide export with SLBB domain